MARSAVPRNFEQAVAELCAAAVAEAREQEYQRRSQQARDAKALRRRRGEHQGGSRPFGWGVTRTPAGIAKLVPIPAEQKAIRDILKMRAEGRSLTTIRDEMRRRGHTRLSHETVRQICFRSGAAGHSSPRPRPWQRVGQTNVGQVNVTDMVPLPRPVALLDTQAQTIAQEIVRSFPTASATAAEPRREALSDPQVLTALDRIRALLEAQDAALAGLRQQRRDAGEHGPMILRRLTDVERLLRGEKQDIGRAPRATRRRPLGVG
jgi:hypothetical protein